MLINSSIIASMALFATTISAADISLWTRPGCSGGGGASVSCINIAYGVCCQSAAPFTNSASGRFTHVGRDFYDYNQQRCNIMSYASARCGNTCCLPLPGGNGAAANYFQGSGPPKRRDIGKPVGREDVDAGNGKNCTEPNQAEFYDNNGNRRTIRIPEGSYEDALALFQTEDYDGLAKFPEWEE